MANELDAETLAITSTKRHRFHRFTLSLVWPFHVLKRSGTSIAHLVVL